MDSFGENFIEVIMSTIFYKRALYRLVADAPSGMGPSNPSDAKSLMPDDKKDRSQSEITENKLPEEPKPYDPNIDEMKERLEKRIERLEKRMSIPIRDLKKLIDMYDLPSAQLLITDFAVSKDRLLGKLRKVVEDLGNL